MDSIKINTGEQRIAINDDPERVIVFNSADIVFAEKFYALVGAFEQKLLEYRTRSKAQMKVKAVDEHGLPVNLQDRIALLREACEYTRDKIDDLFGAGTSQKAFGDALSLDAFMQFFDGITPYVRTVRAQKMAPYSNKRPKRVL